MSSVASGHLHRSSRSARCLAAAALVALAVVLTAVSLMTGRAVGVAAALDVVVAIGAGSLLHAEIMRLRQMVASERAGAAALAAARAKLQADEHVVLMNSLTSTLRFHQAATVHLGTRLHALEMQLAEAQGQSVALRAVS